MQVFEFHFNPNLKPDLIFDSYCYEPENIYERRLGSLYLVGVLKNILPQNVRFLDSLTKVIKERYYRLTLKNPEKALKESLKEANEFLEQIAKKGDVRWLGNLSFGVISLKNYELNFTKVGDLKFLLLRGKRIIDIDRKLKFEEITPWPLQIFGNIVSGKMTEDDVLLVSTKEVTDFFAKGNLLSEMTKLEVLNQKSLKEIFDKRKEEVLKISGVLVIINFTKEALAGKKEVITPKLYPKEFNLREVFSPFTNLFKKITWKPKLKLPLLKLPKLPKPKLVIPKLKLTKNQISISALIFLLVLGFLIAQVEERQKLEQCQTTLNEIQEKVTRAESFLILKETKPEIVQEANLLLRECWEEISPLVKMSSKLPESFTSQIYNLRDGISKNLSQLNNLTVIEEPELIFEFDRREFVPQKITFFNNELYLFSPYAENLFRLSKESKGEMIETGQKINLAAPLEDSVAFFSKPNQLTLLTGGEVLSANLKEPYSGFDFNSLASFRGNLYFLDSKTGEIIRYPAPISEGKDLPKIWLSSQSKKAVGGKSLAVDGSVWVLNKDNSISKYYAGNLQETIELNIFPEAKDFSKISTLPALPYLYILEPTQKRVVIVNKSGQIVEQFQSERFDNLLNFSISDNGRTIYLLNGIKIYKIEL